MKKVIFLVLILVLVSSLSAQDLKLLMGPVVSNYSSKWPNAILYDWPDGTSSLNPFDNHKTGIAGGLGIEFAIGKKMGLEIDSLYFEKGGVFHLGTGFFTTYKEEYELKGLSFPVLLKGRFLPRFFPYVLAGMDFSFILSHERTTWLLPEASVIYEEIGRDNLENATRRLDISPVLGIGFEVPLSRGLVFLEGRYQPGLTNIQDFWGDSQYKARTRTLLILVGYKI